MSNIGGGAVEGAVQLSVVPVSAPYTVQQTDELVQVTTGSSNLVVTLPNPSVPANVGLRVTIEKVDNGSGQARVQGALNVGSGYVLNSLWSSVTVICDGVRWNVVGTVS